MPSQLPGSSLMMPTLVFQVVQFTSSTLRSEEKGEPGAGRLRAMPSPPGRGLGPTGQTQEADKSRWGDIAARGWGDGPPFGHRPGDTFSVYTMGFRDIKYWILGSDSDYQVTPLDTSFSSI